MIRTVVVLLILIFALTLFRSFVSLIGRVFTASLRTSASTQPRQPSSGPTNRGELKQCAGCGVYISATSALIKEVDGQTRYYCSPECRDR